METPGQENSPLDSHIITDKLRARMRRSGKPRLALEKTLPLLLNHLSQVITSGDSESNPRVWIDLNGSSLEDIVSEYDVLKDIILDTLSPLTSEEKNKVIETILYFMGLTAWEYSKQNNLHHEKVERHLNEKIQEEKREKLWFERVLDTLPVGLLIVERVTGNLLFVNKAAKTLAGGFYPMDILPDDQNEYYAVDSSGKRVLRNDLPRFRVARGERLYGLELTVYKPGGHITVVIHSGVIPATEGHPERLVIAFQEIEERKKKEEKQQAIVNDLKEEKSLREAFVSSLTHDLKTPLAVARMHAEMIARKIPPPLLDKCHKVIKHIDEVDRMIQDLLDTNKLKAGEMLPVYPSDICLSDCVAVAVNDFVDLHGDRFILNMQENVCGHWCAKSMRRIIDNLLSNAIKHGDPTRPITISLMQMDHETILKVHNFGPGIPKAEQARLFEPFRRSAKSLKKSGWGIGLSLVKGLVDAQGGKIHLESSDKEGTTFRIWFPNHAIEAIH